MHAAVVTGELLPRFRYLAADRAFQTAMASSLRSF